MMREEWMSIYIKKLLLMAFAIQQTGQKRRIVMYVFQIISISSLHEKGAIPHLMDGGKVNKLEFISSGG